MIEQFKERLQTAYAEWDRSLGKTPQLFYDLMDEAIEFHSILERGFPRDNLSGPFLGKPAVLGYFTAIAESWELISVHTDRIVGEGDTVVRVGRMAWRNRQTLRVIDSPKIDVWTVWNGKAIRYLEMFDTSAYAQATGALDPPLAAG